MKGQMDTEMGKIFVDEDVLAKYAGSAAVECFGVVGKRTRWLCKVVEKGQLASWRECQCGGWQADD